MRSVSFLALFVATSGWAQQLPVRRLTGSDVRLGRDMLTISGVRELNNGRILISDANRPVVLLVDPASGTSSVVGSIGPDSNQYAQPGGFYQGKGDTTLLLDRGQSRFAVISPSGTIITTRSIRRRGFSSSSSDDIDLQRIDSRGLAYFAEMRHKPPTSVGAEVTDTALILRFDAMRQTADTVAVLRQNRRRVTQASANMTMSQSMLGSPVDGWGISPDGQLAIVRAAPYRVEWIGLDGVTVRGDAVAIPAIPFTPQERDSLSKMRAGAGGAIATGEQGAASLKTATSVRWIADVKPPFDASSVIVSPNRHVWVARTSGAGSSGIVYDVFDARGAHVDCVQLGLTSRVIGFGRGVVYAVERDARGTVLLRKYKLS